MKVKEIVFRPLGRPPKAGEWARVKGAATGSFMMVASPDDSLFGVEWEAFERREVEVEVPDAVPEWIVNLGGPDVPYSLLRAFADAFRAHVEERSKVIAKTLANIVYDEGILADMIAEKFLR